MACGRRPVVSALPGADGSWSPPCALLIGVASVGLATAAQATRAGGSAASAGPYVTKVVVRPGQSLWTVAEAYDPDADTRLIIADIEQMNSMTGDQLQPGEVLWVPRG